MAFSSLLDFGNFFVAARPHGPVEWAILAACLLGALFALAFLAITDLYLSRK